MTNLQVGQSLCLPGYEAARCAHVVQTGEWCDPIEGPGPCLPACTLPLAAASYAGSQHGSSASQRGRVLLSLTLPPPPSPHPHPHDADPDRPWCQAYVVQSGDTDTSIASMFGMTTAQLIALNTDYLQGGQSQPYANEYLRLPGW